MACLAAFALIVLFVVVPFAQMLFGKGPNSFRRLHRLDIAAFFVLTAGVAIAFGIARVEESGGMVWILVLVLPFALAFAWLGRYLLEDAFGRRSQLRRDADLSFLTPEPAEDDERLPEDRPPAEGPPN